MSALARHGLPTQYPIISRYGRWIEMEKLPSTGCAHAVRVLNYLPGRTLESSEVRIDPPLLYDIGAHLGKINRVLGATFDPDKVLKEVEWSIWEVPKLMELVYAVQREEDRELILEVIRAYDKEILPNMDAATKSVIHSDSNFGNIIVQEKKPSTDPPTFSLNAIIDFGDLHSSYLVYDLAVLCAYVMLTFNPEQWTIPVNEYSTPKFCVAGFLSQQFLSKLELQMLPRLVALRYAQSLCIGAYSFYVLNPYNESLLDTQKNGWRQLRYLWAADNEKLLQEWLSLVPK